MYKKTGLRKDKGVDVKMEMGDVFSYLFQLAFMLDIDLDDMWNCHQAKVVHRNYIST
jgi:NTP pyrophosphatase (non-canonical NTP hydrolase)